MNIIICLEDNNGYSLFGKRLSRDSAVTEKILGVTTGKRLFVNSYTAKLFPSAENIEVCKAPLTHGDDGDFCFVENIPVTDISVLKKAILFKWNRRYPADMFFNFDLSECGFSLLESEEFSGTSHEKITMEIYVKNAKA